MLRARLRAPRKSGRNQSDSKFGFASDAAKRIRPRPVAELEAWDRKNLVICRAARIARVREFREKPSTRLSQKPCLGVKVAIAGARAAATAFACPLYVSEACRVTSRNRLSSGAK